MIYTHDMQRSIDALDNARSEASYAETERSNAWSAYLRARDRAQDAQETLADAERDVLREAGRLAGQAPRTNRDERRAQVLVGVGSDLDDIPF